MDLDELVSVDELVDWLIAWRQRLSQVRLTQLLDSNGDGMMGADDLQDLTSAWRSMFSALDTDQDEFISIDELSSVVEPFADA